MNLNYSNLFKDHFKLFMEEDDLHKNFNYIHSLPTETVTCKLKLKDDLMVAGLPFFFEAFQYLSKSEINYHDFMSWEGKTIQKKEEKEVSFELPFNILLSGERLALNLLQRASSIATHTSKFVKAAGGTTILDTRKTTPGLRFLEKYAVTVGGGTNHRFSQLDAWMVKDNHKSFFGGVAPAIEFFKKTKSHYKNIIVEIHDVNELQVAASMGITCFMLDNFSVSELCSAIEIKQSDWHFEVSGGINLRNISEYALDGVDAISSGALTYDAPQVDISLKIVK